MPPHLVLPAKIPSNLVRSLQSRLPGLLEQAKDEKPWKGRSQGRASSSLAGCLTLVTCLILPPPHTLVLFARAGVNCQAPQTSTHTHTLTHSLAHTHTHTPPVTSGHTLSLPLDLPGTYASTALTHPVEPFPAPLSLCVRDTHTSPARICGSQVDLVRQQTARRTQNKGTRGTRACLPLCSLYSVHRHPY